MKNPGLPECSLTFAVAFNSILLVCGIPGFSIGNIKFGNDKSVDNTYELVNSKIYNIITSVDTNNGKCTKQVHATGNGIGDVFERPCSPNGVHTVTSDKVLIYGNPKEDAFFLFSNEASRLIVFQDGKCAKRTYKTVTRETFGEEEELSKAECKNIEDKINFIHNEESKYVEALAKHVSGKMPELSTEAQGALSKTSQTSMAQGAQGALSKTSQTSKAQEAQGALSKTSQTSKALNPNSHTNSATRDLHKGSETHQEIPHNGVTEAAAEPTDVKGPAQTAEKHRMYSHTLSRFQKWHF